MHADLGTTLAINGGTFANNAAKNQGGAGPLSPFQGAGAGGAVGVSGGSTGTISGATFSGNLAIGGDGADGAAGQNGGDAGVGAGGAVIVTGISAQNPDVVPSSLIVIDSTFLGNAPSAATAATGGPGATGATAVRGKGGALEASVLGTATIIRCSFIAQRGRRRQGRRRRRRRRRRGRERRRRRGRTGPRLDRRP